jgi:hypothetical protein
MAILKAGAHTGKYGFDTFTHQRATLDSPALYVACQLQRAEAHCFQFS